MAGLLNHDKDKVAKNPDKNVDVKATQVTREEAGFTDNESSKDTEFIPTFDVNMRIDNHTRNAVLALSRATAEKRTASEMVSILIEEYLKDTSTRTQDIYREFINAFEEKDRIMYKLKTKN